MQLLAALALFTAQSAASSEIFVANLRAAVGSGVEAKVQSLFARPQDSSYLLEMARERGGLRTIKVSVIPAPPGWEDTGKLWAVFHNYQAIENHHDPVHAVIQTGDGLRLSREVVENAITGYRITETGADVHLVPARSEVKVSAWLDLAKSGTQKAPIFRLADHFDVTSGSVTGGAASHVVDADAGPTVVKPQPGDIVRAGSVVIPWAKSVGPRVSFTYNATLPPGREEQVGPKVAYLTAWWVPSLGRLPHKSNVRITGPKDWVLQSEGNQVDAAKAAGMSPKTGLGAGEKVVAWRCEIPISYPKVVAGTYQLAAELKVGDKTVRSYQLDPVSNERGKKQCKLMADMLVWCEKNLGPWPFDSYACFDGLGYYGIESYSYTLLAPGIIDWAVSHEMGHTYFGGLVPCAYVRDAWNEGMTQYVDSIRYKNNADRSLENGLATMRVTVPMSQIPIAWAFGSATYYRGAYVMKMLEAEIGSDNVLRGIQAIIRDRVGKDTAWVDLRPYFERASGVSLDWYWTQWIESATYPKLQIIDANRVARDGRSRTWITVKQTGTGKPYRMKFLLRVTRGAESAEQLVTLTGGQGMFSVDSNFAPSEATIEVFPYTMATKGPAVRVTN
jgi:hypothetical protein